MRIALTYCHSSVIPNLYNAPVPRLILLLAKELTSLNHTVTIFCSKDSKINIEGVTHIGMHSACPEDDSLNHQCTNELLSHIRSYGAFDIVHNHCNNHALSPLQNIQEKMPVLNTIHDDPSEYNKLNLQKYTNMNFVCLSKDHADAFAFMNPMGFVYNGIDTENYPHEQKALSYHAVFAGRICADKSPHLAIEVAARAKIRIILMGKIYYEDQNYAEQTFYPALAKYEGAQYIGAVDYHSVAEHYHNAFCSIHSATFREPCPLSAIESLASGCPVLAFRKGSYPEIVESGKTGYIVDSIDEMSEALSDIHNLDRAQCALSAQNRFNYKRMTQDYLEKYNQVISMHAAHHKTQ